MKLFSRITLVSLTVAAIALLPACSRESATSTPAPAAASPNAESATRGDDVTVGKPSPAFTVNDHEGTVLSLAALKGKSVVLYFYPKDETPGCTKEACSFRDAWKDLDKKGVVLIGISTDSEASHKAFAKHHELPFHLVSDASGRLANLYGVPNRGGFLGRQTFVIGADGNVKKIYRDVDVSKHASEILADLSL